MVRKNFFMIVAIPAMTIGIALLLASLTKMSYLGTNSSSYPPPYPLPVGGGTPVQPADIPPNHSGPSQAARNALAYIAERKGISPEKLRITADRSVEYPMLVRTFQVVQILDTEHTLNVYNLLVDLSDGHIEEDIYAVANAEQQAYLAKYGKMEAALYERLQEMSDPDTIKVAVWVKAPPGESENEYYELLDERINSRVALIVSTLKQQGYTVETFRGMPAFTATLPKSMIIELSMRDDVRFIYLAIWEIH